mgnify:FL=1
MSIIYKYLKFLPHFLKVTGIAFSLNIFLYTFLKPKIGINASGFIAEIAGTLVLYSILRLSRRPKINKTIYGVSVQYLISAITVAINIIALNIINLFYINYLIKFNFISTISETYISIFSKILASILGMIWTSSMTMKFSFNFDTKT